jgi:hypothetical protein
MPVVPNLEGLLPTPLLPPEELEKERHGDEESIDGWLKSSILYLSISKEEGVCGLPRSASSPDLNRPNLNMEKWRGVVNTHQGR